MVYVWRLEGILWVFSFRRVGPRIELWSWGLAASTLTCWALLAFSCDFFILTLWSGQVVRYLRTQHFLICTMDGWVLQCLVSLKSYAYSKCFLWPLPLMGPGGGAFSAVWGATQSVWGHCMVLSLEPCAVSRVWLQTLNSKLWHSSHQENCLGRWICERSPQPFSWAGSGYIGTWSGPWGLGSSRNNSL